MTLVLEEDLSLPWSRNTLRVRVIPGSGRTAVMTDLEHVRDRAETRRRRSGGTGGESPRPVFIPCRRSGGGAVNA